MPEGPRSFPSRPSLRYLKVEAKRRLAAGEFPTLNDAQAAIAREHGLPSWTALKQLIYDQPQQQSHALSQLRWVIARFRDAGAQAWTAPSDHELRQHFDDRFLTETPPGELIAAITSVAAHLGDEPIVMGQSALQAVPTGRRSTDTRVAAPPPARIFGDVPDGMAGIADEGFAELGLAGLVL